MKSANMSEDRLQQVETMAKDETSVRMKKVYSFSIWFGTFSFGLAYNSLSPALEEFEIKYGTTTDEISKVFTVILLAYLVGAIICGTLFNYLNRQLMVSGVLYIMATGTLALPHLPTKIQFFIVGGIIGFGCGGYDTSQIVWMLEMWHGEAGVWFQAQYCVFAVGNLIAPLMIAPFLIEAEKITNSSSSSTTPQPYDPSESQLYIPLSIGGAIMALAATNIFVLYIFKKYKPPARTVIPRSQEFSNVSESRRGKIILIVLSALTLGAYQGMEICTFQFLPTFTRYIKLGLSKAAGALVLSGFTAAFAAGRFLGVIVSHFRVAPFFVLVGNLIFAFSGNTILFFSNDNRALLWLGSVLLGLGYSTVFACIYDHIEKYLKITNTIAAIMVVSGGLLSAMYPLIIGEFVENYPFVLTYTVLGSMITCSVTFAIIYWITVVKSKNPAVIIDDDAVNGNAPLK